MSNEAGSCADIILLYRMQALIAERKGWIRRDDVARAERAYVERRSRGERIDLAVTIADLAGLTQSDLDELRKLAMIELAKIETVRESPGREAPGPAPPSSFRSSPSRRTVALAGLAAGVLAVGGLFAFLEPAGERDLEPPGPAGRGPERTGTGGSSQLPDLPAGPSPVEQPARVEPRALAPAAGENRPEIPARSEPAAAGDPETRAFLERVFSGDDPDTRLDLDTPPEPIGPEEFLRRLRGDG